MGTARDPVNNQNPPVKTRGLSRIEEGALALLGYTPTGTGRFKEGRLIEITTEQFRVKDTEMIGMDYETGDEIKLHVGSTVNDSGVYIKAEHSVWYTIGYLLRLRVCGPETTIPELLMETVNETDTNRYESVAAAADIPLNQPILDWYQWSNRVR